MTFTLIIWICIYFMSSCLVMTRCFVHVNYEPRTRSLSFACALSLLANTLDPFLKTSCAYPTLLCRLIAHICGQGAAFHCALCNWFRSSSMKEWTNRPAGKSWSEERTSWEKQLGFCKVSVYKNWRRQRRRFKVKTCCILCRREETKTFFLCDSKKKKKIFSFTVNCIFGKEILLVVSEDRLGGLLERNSFRLWTFSFIERITLWSGLPFFTSCGTIDFRLTVKTKFSSSKRIFLLWTDFYCGEGLPLLVSNFFFVRSTFSLAILYFFDQSSHALSPRCAIFFIHRFFSLRT